MWLSSMPSELSTLYDCACREEQAGRDHLAQGLFRSALAVDPRHAQSLRHLAGLAKRQGNLSLALAWLDKAVEYSGKAAGVYLADQAEIYLILGETDKLEQVCKKALPLLSDDPDALFSFGVVRMQQGCSDLAEQHLRDSLKLRPEFPMALSNLGVVLAAKGLQVEAEASYRKAVTLRPGFAEAWCNLGVLLLGSGQYAEAERSLQMAITLSPKMPAAYSNLGDLLRIVGRPVEAEQVCRKALALKPDYPAAYLNLANSLREQGKLSEAEKIFRELISSGLEWVNLYSNLGCLLFDKGELEEAILFFEKALDIDGSYVDAHVNLGMTLLSMGRYADGWKEYDWRVKQSLNKEFRRNFTQPLWNGEDAKDKVVLLHADEGYGDTLQFYRFVRLAAQKCRVVLEVQKPLATLLAVQSDVARVIARGDSLPDFDLQCPLLSLPGILGIGDECFTGQVPYIAANPSRVDVWRRRAEKQNGLRVGLAWAGNPSMAADSRRSIDPKHFSVLADVPGVSFISLQKETGTTPLRVPGLSLQDWTADLSDFSETAALMQCLDLVICVDTAVAHLAGALGRPVWLLNRFDSCWRWGRQGNSSSWYPTLRQFRQLFPGDWGGVLTRVKQALIAASHAGQHGRPQPSSDFLPILDVEG